MLKMMELRMEKEELQMKNGAKVRSVFIGVAHRGTSRPRIVHVVSW